MLTSDHDTTYPDFNSTHRYTGSCIAYSFSTCGSSAAHVLMIAPLALSYFMALLHKFYVLALITQKLHVQVACTLSTYQTIALQWIEISIFCVGCGVEVQLASYGSKHALESLFHEQFGRTYTPALKTTGRIWTLCISNDCSTIKDCLCGLELHERIE